MAHVGAPGGEAGIREDDMGIPGVPLGVPMNHSGQYGVT